MAGFVFLMFQVFTTTQFQCRDCFYIGPLDIRGCCDTCGSGSVIPQELFSSSEHKHPLPLARSG
jgi:hypothetical protein